MHMWWRARLWRAAARGGGAAAPRCSVLTANVPPAAGRRLSGAARVGAKKRTADLPDRVPGAVLSGNGDAAGGAADVAQAGSKQKGALQRCG